MYQLCHRLTACTSIRNRRPRFCSSSLSSTACSSIRRNLGKPKASAACASLDDRCRELPEALVFFLHQQEMMITVIPVQEETVISQTPLASLQLGNIPAPYLHAADIPVLICCLRRYLLAVCENTGLFPGFFRGVLLRPGGILLQSSARSGSGSSFHSLIFSTATGMSSHTAANRLHPPFSRIIPSIRDTDRPGPYPPA